MPITRADGHVIRELGGKQPVAVHARAVRRRSTSATRSCSATRSSSASRCEEGHIEFRGDFLVRNIVGVDPNTGALAVGAQVRAVAGAAVPPARRQDGRARSVGAPRALSRGAPPAGALLFSCLGRGRDLFGRPDHDTDLFRARVGAGAARRLLLQRRDRPRRRRRPSCTATPRRSGSSATSNVRADAARLPGLPRAHRARARAAHAVARRRRARLRQRAPAGGAIRSSTACRSSPPTSTAHLGMALGRRSSSTASRRALRRAPVDLTSTRTGAIAPTPPPDGPGGRFGMEALAAQLAERAARRSSAPSSSAAASAAVCTSWRAAPRASSASTRSWRRCARARGSSTASRSTYGRRVAGRHYARRASTRRRRPRRPACTLVCADAMDPPLVPGELRSRRGAQRARRGAVAAAPRRRRRRAVRAGRRADPRLALRLAERHRRRRASLRRRRSRRATLRRRLVDGDGARGALHHRGRVPSCRGRCAATRARRSSTACTGCARANRARLRRDDGARDHDGRAAARSSARWRRRRPRSPTRRTSTSIQRITARARGRGARARGAGPRRSRSRSWPRRARRRKGKLEVVLTQEQRERVKKLTGVDMQSVIVADEVGVLSKAMPHTSPRDIEQLAISEARKLAVAAATPTARCARPSTAPFDEIEQSGLRRGARRARAAQGRPELARRPPAQEEVARQRALPTASAIG